MTAATNDNFTESVAGTTDSPQLINSINDLSTTILYRVLAGVMVTYAFLFIFNDYLIFFQGWPGPLNFLKHQECEKTDKLNPAQNDEVILEWIA